MSSPIKGDSIEIPDQQAFRGPSPSVSDRKLAPTLVLNSFSLAFSPVKSGWVRKRDCKGKLWHRKYLAVFPHAIVWTSEKATKLTGVIPLTTYHYAAQLMEKAQGKRFDLLLEGDDNVRHKIKLQGETSDEAADWVEVIRAIHQRFVKIPGEPLEALSGIRFWKNVDELTTLCQEYEKTLGPRAAKMSIAPNRVGRKSRFTPQSLSQIHSRDSNEPDSNSSPVNSPPLSPTAAAAANGMPSLQLTSQTSSSSSSSSSSSQQVVNSKPDPNATGHKKCYYDGMLRAKVSMLGVKTYKPRYYYLYDGTLEYAAQRGGEIVGETRLDLVEAVKPHNLEHDPKRGFRVDIYIRTSSEHSSVISTETLSLYADTNTLRSEWMKQIKERLYMHHVGKGDEEGERRAEEVGQMPEVFGEDFIFSKGDQQDEDRTKQLREMMASKAKHRPGMSSGQISPPG